MPAMIIMPSRCTLTTEESYIFTVQPDHMSDTTAKTSSPGMLRM